jgi:TPR repeat protein
MYAEIHMTHPRTLLGAALALLSNVGEARDTCRGDWLGDPAMGHYKAYAEFKMARYAEAREVWATLAEAGDGEALFNLGILAEEGLGEPRNPGKAEGLYIRAARAGDFKARYRLGWLA